MALFTWSSKLETGIDQIDGQHKRLVGLINQLHDEVSRSEPDHAAVGDVLAGLIDYTYDHFIVEEEMFQRFEYPHEDAHRDEHNSFTARAHELLAQHEKGETPGQEALEFLKDWLTHHIMEVDMAYVPFFQDKGVP